jgi:ribosomal protein L37AE/L43A
MKEKHQCPECGTRAMTKLKVFDRWWCTTCKTELDVDKIINEWATKGYSRKDNYDVKA